MAYGAYIKCPGVLAMAAVKTIDIETLLNVTEFTHVLVWFLACIGLP